MRWVLLAALMITGSARAAGLLAPADETLPPLRVTDHIVDVSIHDQVALTEVTQTFHNDTGRRLEATYVFPLPENADLTDFQMTFNGKMLKGEVLPADEARRVYESIVRRTRDPGLIEFIGRRLLQMRVFPIEPNSDTTIKMRYQQIARPISGMHGYHYPLRTRKTVGQAYGMVRFTVSLDTKAPLKNIWSPSHAVEIVRQGERAARIAYEASGGSLEDDFLLLYDTDASDLGLSVIAYRPDGSRPGHFALMLTPKQLWPETSYLPQDVVFVIDTSGSMSGEKIQQARRALQFCIDKLDERDRFNVVRFSTGFDVVFPELVPAIKENRAQAQDFAGRFTAAGGTNIADTLHHVLGLRPATAPEDRAARPFVVVFLTDGQGNREPDEIMKRLAEVPGAAKHVRIFPFGVGHDVNTILLDRLAGDYTGRTTYVQPGENLELVLGDFFSVVSRPVLTNLRITLPGIGVSEQFPATLGDLYHGQQIIIAGQFNTTATGPVKLSAVREGEALEYVWPDVSFMNTAEASYVPSVWAGRKISYLIDQIRTHGESQEMIAEIVQLSQSYGIQTPYTSWLVAPEEEQRIALGRRWRGGRPPAGQPSLPPAVRQSVRRDAPGKGGGFGGGGAAGASERLYDTSGDSITLGEAQEAVTAARGKNANFIARKNAQLREMRTKDKGRLDTSRLPIRKLGGRWYHRIGGFLVDEDVNEQTKIVTVKFGSDAYFGLIQGRTDLREALAASRNVIVMVSANTALLVADDEGIERFSPEQKEQFGLTRG
ncbi:MAG: VIT domain-containing protein [Planctomycetota bacterium]|jgi:Ca-activated chloride channel family protein